MASRRRAREAALSKRDELEGYEYDEPVGVYEEEEVTSRGRRGGGGGSLLWTIIIIVIIVLALLWLLSALKRQSMMQNEDDSVYLTKNHDGSVSYRPTPNGAPHQGFFDGLMNKVNNVSQPQGCGRLQNGAHNNMNWPRNVNFQTVQKYGIRQHLPLMANKQNMPMRNAGTQAAPVDDGGKQGKSRKKGGKRGSKDQGAQKVEAKYKSGDRKAREFVKYGEKQ